MRVLEEAAAAAAPVRILDSLPLYLGNAVAADSHHVLRHLGITHVLNATEVCKLVESWQPRFLSSSSSSSSYS
jgi:atypical dual specificity phosphatase